MVDKLEVDEVGLDELVVDEVKNRPSGCRRGARLPFVISYIFISSFHCSSPINLNIIFVFK